MNAASLGVRQFEGSKPGEVQVFACGGIGKVYGLVVRSGSGINTPADLKGKKLAYPDVFPVYQIMADAILTAYGLTRRDVTLVQYTSTEKLPDMARTRRVDAFVCPIIAGTDIVLDLTTTRDGYIVSIAPDKIDACVKATGGLYWKGSIPARTYKGQDKEILGFAAADLYHLRSVLPESLVYAMTRVFWEHLKELIDMGGGTANQFSNAKDSVLPRVFVVPFHAGAVRYYKEIGVWTAEQEALQQKLEKELKERLAEWEKKKK